MTNYKKAKRHFLCRKCRQPITVLLSKEGRWYPIDVIPVPSLGEGMWYRRTEENLVLCHQCSGR